MKIFLNILWLTTICVICWDTGHAIEVYHPTLIQSAPKIDGILDESIWSNTFEVSDFKKIDPDTKEIPQLQTRFKLAYDKKDLYIAVICEQSPETLVRRISARDSNLIKRDAIEVILDPSGEGLYGYAYEVALGGSLIDGTVRPPRMFSYSWDCPIEARTTFDDSHWYVELRIPWDAMEFPDRNGKRHIGIYLKREVAHLGEMWAIPAISINSDIFISDFNMMVVNDINPGGRITFYPYVSVDYDNVKYKRRENIGTDLFWQPSSDLLISATINPDFGDVESDDIVVNFNNTESFFSDKRSFFVEGNDIFKTKGHTVVHTRRIGETPDRPEVSTGERVISTPTTSDIIVAAKITGQKKNLRFGLMSAFEDENDFTVNHPTNGSYEISENGRNFHALRTLFESNGASKGYFALGYLGTFAHKNRYDAWVHSVDGIWRTSDKRFRIESQILTSDVDGEQGYAWNGKAVFNPDPNKDLWFQLDYIDDSFEINDMGYVSRNDRLGYHFEYRSSHYNLKGLKGLSWNVEAYGTGNDRLLNTRIGGKFFPKFHNLMKAYAEIYYIAPAWDDRSSYGHGEYRTKEGYHIYFSWYSDESKPIHIYINPAFYTGDNGGLTKKLQVKLKFTPLDRWIIESEAIYYNKTDWILWSYANSSMNGFDADYVTADISSNYKLSHNQELRFGIHWVGIDATGKTVYNIGPDGHLIPTAENAAISSFDYTQFIGQIRYKYEFAPLSDIFVVYNRGGMLRRGMGDKEDDLGSLFMDSVEDKDVDRFIVKIRYRF